MPGRAGQAGLAGPGWPSRRVPWYPKDIHGYPWISKDIWIPWDPRGAREAQNNSKNMRKNDANSPNSLVAVGVLVYTGLTLRLMLGFMLRLLFGIMFGFILGLMSIIGHMHGLMLGLMPDLCLAAFLSG